MKYIIYKITIEDYIYVGSTRHYTKRKCDHKFHCNSKTDRYVYNKINELGGWDKAIITPIEELECDNKIQALIKEEFHRKELKATLNMVTCYNTIEEDKQKKKEYREKNREHILEIKKEHYYLHREENIKKSKEYQKLHVDEIKQKHKLYHESNREKIRLKNNEVIICECGKSYTKANRARHLKTHL